MAIEVGERVPAANLQRVIGDQVEPIDTQKLFAGRRVILFAVPGAFTPTCSAKHLPGFVAKAAEIRAKGVDAILCLAVNDAFVMKAWAAAQNVGDRIEMLADGNGEFSRALGLAFDGSKFGMGERCQRFAARIDDGVVRYLAVEAPGKFEVSSAEAVLAAL